MTRAGGAASLAGATARPSDAARRKATSKHTDPARGDPLPVHSFHTLLAGRATWSGLGATALRWYSPHRRPLSTVRSSDLRWRSPCSQERCTKREPLAANWGYSFGLDRRWASPSMSQDVITLGEAGPWQSGGQRSRSRGVWPASNTAMGRCGRPLISPNRSCVMFNSAPAARHCSGHSRAAIIGYRCNTNPEA
jgi:hypothetical protein